jgi:Flp pilus assembly protein TadG
VRNVRRTEDSGSVTVELVVITPVLLIVALLSLVFGRVSQARQQVAEAARAGAEAAAVLPSAAAAQWGAPATAVMGLIGSKHTCAHVDVVTDTSHFFPGGYVTVRVTCQVLLSDLGVRGLPGSTSVQASATAPLDPYRATQ